ncbi:hypothetical protein GALL_538720 [mine drainage metagenome]|uniref:Uncharacterized protein n=1 Tax=mine drainage metagenome TaxID=410659 RepID=A0A1J5NZ86_9ZZZZ
MLSATTATPLGIWNTSTTPTTCLAAVASKLATVAPKRGACATMAVSILGRWTSWVNRAVPSLLAWASLRRTRSVPIRVKLLGSFSLGAFGGVTLAASGRSSAKVALLPEAWPTTPSFTVISPAGRFHLLEAASTNMARAEAPAWRSWVQLLAMADDPPVPCTPIFRLA